MGMHAEQVDETTSRKKRRLRFSMRSLLIVVTLLSLWFGLVYRRVQDARRAAEAIEDAHGTIVYDWQVRPADSDPSFKPQPSEPEWLRKLLGAHWLDEIVEVQLNEYINPSSKNRFTVVGPHLLKLRGLRSLSLSSSHKGFEHEYFGLLGELTQIEKLYLRDHGEIKQQDFSLLAGAEGIRDLQLSGAKITPVALGELAKLPHLEVLRIDCYAFDPQTGNTLTEYQLRDEAAEVLADFPRLRSLMLYHTQITDKGIAALSRLSGLETLVVGSPHITSESFDEVVKLQNLEHLGTWGWQIEDTDLEKLLALPRLNSLGLQTRLTDASLPNLVSFKRIKTLGLRGDGITDDGIHNLAQLTQLKWLNLRGTNVDKLGTAAQELKLALPDCKIMLPKTEREKEIERSFNAWKWGGMRNILQKGKSGTE